MEAREQAFSFIVANHYFDIPFFQRNYVWDIANWKDLLDTLCESKTSFLGSVILKQELIRPGEVARFMVIDGQQRLTTMTILLRACYDAITASCKLSLSDDVVHDLRKMMEAMCYVRTNSFTGEKKVKIRHSHVDRASFERVVAGGIEGDNSKSDKIIECYKYFRTELSEYSPQKLQNLWDVLTSGSTKLIVIIDLKPEENEQAIFDAINTSGLRLTCAETIKNYLFSKLMDAYRDNGIASFEDEVFRIYEMEWQSVFCDSGASAFWSTEILSGRLKRDNLEVLLHSVAVIYGFFDPEEQKFSDLAECYKLYLDRLSKDDLIRFTKEIHMYAILFRDKMQINENTRFEFDDYLPRLLCICSKLEISTFNPYILYILKLYSDEDILRHKCFELERYIIAHAVCNATTKNYNKECTQIIKNTNTLDALLKSDYEINDSQFMNTMNDMKRKDKIAKLLLFWCELYLRKNNDTDVKSLTYSFELEHVMPKSWKQCWSCDSLPVYDNCGTRITDQERAEEIRSKSIFRIGNLLLLNKRLNIKIGNACYHDKVNGQGQNKGMKALADCYMTRTFIANHDMWDERGIENRTYELINYIRTIWKLPFAALNSSNSQVAAPNLSNVIDLLDRSFIDKISCDPNVVNALSNILRHTDIRRLLKSSKTSEFTENAPVLAQQSIQLHQNNADVSSGTLLTRTPRSYETTLSGSRSFSREIFSRPLITESKSYWQKSDALRRRVLDRLQNGNDHAATIAIHIDKCRKLSDVLRCCELFRIGKRTVRILLQLVSPVICVCCDDTEMLAQYYGLERANALMGSCHNNLMYSKAADKSVALPFVRICHNYTRLGLDFERGFADEASDMDEIIKLCRYWFNAHITE